MSGVHAPPPVPATLRTDLSERALEHGRNLLSCLFMAVRTAQIHAPTNRALVQSVHSAHRAAETLVAATGGFSLQFVEDVAFLNGTRVRFETGSFGTVRNLRQCFERHGLGGLTLRAPPTYAAIERLIHLLGGAPVTEAAKEELGSLQVGLLGPQRFADAGPVRVDRRVFAVQCYAKLLLALREQRERLRSGPVTEGVRPQLRVVRVVQDLVELCGDRPDFLLRLGGNRTGADPFELVGANACVLAAATGFALGLERSTLVDLGVAGLLHHIDVGLGRGLPDRTGAPTAIVELLEGAELGPSSFTRALLVAERPTLDAGARTTDAHPLARLLGVVVAYVQRTIGFGVARHHPLDALAAVYNEPEHFDRRFADLLVNTLRAFPVGAEVVLDDGRSARVHSHTGGSRWDRPVVVPDEQTGPIDLMVRRDGRFERRIVGTRPFVEGGRWTTHFADSNLPSVDLSDPKEPSDDLGLELPPLDEEDPFEAALRALDEL